LLARAPPPTDPASRARLESVRASLASAGALLGAGRYQEGEAQARLQVAAARELGYAPVLAEALELHGRLQEKAGDPVAAESTLEEAELTAEASRDDALATRASAQLADLLLRQSELARGQSWLRHGEASLQRSGGDDALRARLLEVRSRALATAGDHAGAVRLMLSALELKERAYGRDHLEVAASLDLLARALKEPDQRPRALELARRALRVVEAALGPNHPDVADALAAVGQVHRDMEQFQQELDCARRALAIRERALGPDHLAVAAARWNLGTALHNLGDMEGALEQFRAALAAFERAYGPDHVRVATLRGNIAGLQVELGDDQQALAAWQRILAAYERAFGHDRPQNIHALRGVALALGMRRRFAEADAYLERTFAAARILSPENPDLFFAYSDQAELLRLEGRFSQARAAEERAIQLLGKMSPEPSLAVAAQQISLARLLCAEGKPEQALAVAQPARAALEAGFGADHRLVADALAVEGEAARATGNASRAVELLERAVRLRDKWRYRPELEAESRFSLARALGLDASQRARARELAAAAREDFTRSGDRQRAAAASAWIAEHP
ncbi:MAG TPA: tetratricopeptide repeat protein, partial [Myxococcales bacterium]|nr:tetratricopeptide repeat protein [Myxococcales bacterium]